jgi:hypothetical protein
MAIHELELDALAQTGEQGRPVSGKDRLHKELVLVDQSQRQGERHATHEQALAWLLLEPLNRLPQVASHRLGIPIGPAQSWIISAMRSARTSGRRLVASIQRR